MHENMNSSLCLALLYGFNIKMITDKLAIDVSLSIQRIYRSLNTFFKNIKVEVVVMCYIGVNNVAFNELLTSICFFQRTGPI